MTVQDDRELLLAIRDNLALNTAKTDQLLRAFPNGDIEGHRRYHEAMLERLELRNTLVRAALVKLAQAGALAAFGWVLLALWQAFKITVKQ